jgi:hypothetical protein
MTNDKCSDSALALRYLEFRSDRNGAKPSAVNYPVLAKMQMMIWTDEWQLWQTYLESTPYKVRN